MSLENLMNKAQDRNYSLGHLFMDCMKRKPPEVINQIDAATGESETNASVLSRSIRLARCCRKLGLEAGDVLALGGRNHLDLHIPFYAATLNGYPIVGVDPYFKYAEIKHLFEITSPKIAFCQKETLELYERAANELELDMKIYTFDGEGNTFSRLMDTCPQGNDEDFQVAEIDPDKVYGWLVSTSGTTGLPKVAAFKHQSLVQQILYFCAITKFSPDRMNISLNLAPVQWISGYFNALGMPLMNLCKLQTSRPDDVGHVIDIINDYKPISMMASPSIMASILQHEKPCDLTCFRSLTLTGAKVYTELISDVKGRLRPDCVLMVAYGQTETLGPSLRPNINGPLGSCGTALPSSVRLVKTRRLDCALMEAYSQTETLGPSLRFNINGPLGSCDTALPTSVRLVKLVNPETGLEVTEPGVPGELWTKGPCFAEYYKNPEETVNAFTEDGWYKTGDLLYKDENNNFFFYDRIKMLIKYMNYHINPLEIEEVISKLDGVLEVCVVGIPHPTDGQRAAACVVTRHHCDVTEEAIKNLVASNLSPAKHLRGGVLFLPSLPKTSTGKVARGQVITLAINGHKDQ